MYITRACGWRGFASFMPFAERSKVLFGAAGSGSKNRSGFSACGHRTKGGPRRRSRERSESGWPGVLGPDAADLGPRRQSPDFQHGAQRKARAFSGGVESQESAAFPSGEQKMFLRQSAPFAAPVGLDGVFPVQREGSSLPLPLPVPAVSLRFSTWSAAESRFGGVDNRSLTASGSSSLRRSCETNRVFPVRLDGRAH